jgi:hypothetical protein
MNSFLPKFFDVVMRKHPRIMLILVLALALAASWVLIGSGNSILVYEGF